MNNTIYGIECVEIDKNTIYSEINEVIKKMKDSANAPRRPSKLLLTSKQTFLINFESIMYEIAGKFKLSKREYKLYRKQTGKLMKMILKFKQ